MAEQSESRTLRAPVDRAALVAQLALVGCEDVTLDDLSPRARLTLRVRATLASFAGSLR